MHQAMGAERVLPAEGLVDALRSSVLVNQQVLWAHRIAKVRPVKRLACLVACVWLRVCLGRLGVGRLEAKAAWNLDRTKQDLQDVQRAAGLEAVRVRRNSAHGMKAHGAANHLGVFLAFPVGPRLVDDDLFFKGHACKVCCQRFDP